MAHPPRASPAQAVTRPTELKGANEVAAIKELSEALTSIIEHAQGILDEAEHIRAMLSQPEEPDAKAYTLTEVRAKLTALSTSGHRAEVRELLTRYGAQKLTEINPANYTALMADAEGIGA